MHFKHTKIGFLYKPEKKRRFSTVKRTIKNRLYILEIENLKSKILSLKSKIKKALALNLQLHLQQFLNQQKHELNLV